MNTLRVIFDAYWWVRGPISNRTVQLELIHAWLRLNPQDEVTLVVPAGDLSAVDNDFKGRVNVVGTHLRPHGLAAALDVPRVARRLRANIAITHNFAPVFGSSAVFVHDVLFQTQPTWFTPLERAYFALIPLLMPRAGIVLTSSRHEALRIATQNDRVNEIVPIGLGISSALTSATARPPIRGLSEGFLLCVGRLNIRKNLAFSIEAAILSGILSLERPLIVVGQADGLPVELPKGVLAAVEAGLVVFLGSVDAAELAWLYSHAALLIYMTRDEGFGLPPVEALAFGCPVLVSDIPVLRETVGHHAYFADPGDPRGTASAIAGIIATGLKTKPIPATSWDDCARRMRSAIITTGLP